MSCCRFQTKRRERGIRAEEAAPQAGETLLWLTVRGTPRGAIQAAARCRRPAQRFSCDRNGLLRTLPGPNAPLSTLVMKATIRKPRSWTHKPVPWTRQNSWAGASTFAKAPADESAPASWSGLRLCPCCLLQKNASRGSRRGSGSAGRRNAALAYRPRNAARRHSGRRALPQAGAAFLVRAGRPASNASRPERPSLDARSAERFDPVELRRKRRAARSPVATASSPALAVALAGCRRRLQAPVLRNRPVRLELDATRPNSAVAFVGSPLMLDSCLLLKLSAIRCGAHALAA